MALIPKNNEVLSAQVDGITNEFTTLFPVYALSDVILGGSEILGTTFVTGGNKITLPVVPTLGWELYIDYFTETSGSGLPSGITVERAFQSLEFVKKNISNISTTNRLEMANNVNREIYDEYLGSDPSSFISSLIYSVSNGTSTHALPSDFQDIINFQAGFYLLDSKGNEMRRLPNIEQLAGQESFFIEGGNVIFYNIGTGQNIKLKYIPSLADFTLLTDTFCIDSRWLDLVRAGLLVQYSIFDKDSAGEVEASIRFTNLLSNFTTKVTRTPKVMVLPRANNRSIRSLRYRNY